MAFSTVSATSSHIPIHNYSQSILNEVKKFYKHVNQLNILLKETNNACRELKSLQQSSVLSEDMENLQINDLDEKFIKALQKKKICLVILGQNALAQSILVNELLGRYLLPFEINTALKEENWRFVRIKHSKIGGYTYQLVESEFEVMSSEQLNKKFTFATPSKQVSSLPGTNTRVGMSKSNSPKNSSSSLTKSSQNQLLVGSSNNSSSNFTIPIDVLRLDEGLIRARTRVDEAKTLAEIDAARDRLVEVEAIAENHAILEVTLDLKLLENNFEILVHSRSMKKSILECILADVIPVYVYGIIERQLSDQDAKELSRLKSIVNGHPILFVKIPEVDQYIDRMPSPSPQSVDSSSQTKKANALLKYLHQVSSQQITHTHVSDSSTSSSFEVFKHLCDLGYLNALSTINEPGGNSGVDDYLNEQRSNSEVSLIRDDGVSTRLWVIQSEFCEKWHLFMPIFCTYLKRYLKSFSARDMLVTPRKIEYAREKEQILYESLISLASMKQEELKNLINSAIETHREQILDEVRSFQFVDVELISCRESPTQEIIGDELSADSISSSSTPSPRPASSCEEPISAFDSSKQFLTVRYARDYKKCTSQIQELVISRLNNAIAQKLIESVEILKENYLGTLKRCLITLEEMNLGPNTSFSEANSASVSEALQQIVNAAYHVELNISGSSSFVKILILRMKELIKNMPWSASPKLDEEWKVQIAANMLNSLSESKLAKILCNQMKERLKSSHNLFTNSLRLLELRHTGRLEKNEENQALIRKILAPKFAKLCLESTSLKDYVLYGFPSLGREIGRGQYGVVYSCARWGRYENLAVKSVVPPDEKHWNDLALEFHYTKQIADHERIVKLLGSVIDYTYGNGQSPAVLLIMEAMKRDLYSALKSGLDWKTRVRISIDVVHGIRYLHSLGLVHRDIKLKNVLLDEKNRAKITDLGFCKPEAMMSGSIVGTPVHMCPEMFNSKYDNTVDIYAFGILFWYICAGAVTLPKNFETCGTKDDLWSAVKRGVRPERLPIFDEDSWRLMEMCWRHDPKQRPHIGVVNDQLMAIMAKYDA